MVKTIIKKNEKTVAIKSDEPVDCVECKKPIENGFICFACEIDKELRHTWCISEDHRDIHTNSSMVVTKDLYIKLLLVEKTVPPTPDII